MRLPLSGRFSWFYHLKVADVTVLVRCIIKIISYLIACRRNTSYIQI